MWMKDSEERFNTEFRILLYSYTTAVDQVQVAALRILIENNLPRRICAVDESRETLREDLVVNPRKEDVLLEQVEVGAGASSLSGSPCFGSLFDGGLPGRRFSWTFFHTCKRFVSKILKSHPRVKKLASGLTRVMV
jgi:hypothetical protein